MEYIFLFFLSNLILIGIVFLSIHVYNLEFLFLTEYQKIKTV